MDEIFLHVHPSAIENNQFYLSRDESYHFLKSLRGSVGDEVWLLDGKGLAYQARVKKIDNSIVQGSINDSFAGFGENKKNIHLVIGLIKGKRMDLAIEKSVEFGVKSIHPVLFDRSIKKRLNIERLNKIVISSAKQTGRSVFPEIKKIIKFPDWIKKYKNYNSLACHYTGKFKIKNVVNSKTNDVMIIVGPEGDFSSSEIELLNVSKIPLVSLGIRRLRTESACISSILETNDAIER